MDFFAATGLLFSSHALAMYRLELLAFLQPSISTTSETWSAHPAEPQLKSQYAMFEQTELKDLASYREKLSAKTKILGESAWLFDESGTIKLDLSVENNKLWGYLMIHQSRYISVESSLLFEVEKGQLPFSIRRQFSESIAKFPLKERHRLIPGSAYYYDHPVIGLLVQIAKI